MSTTKSSDITLPQKHDNHFWSGVIFQMIKIYILKNIRM
ncbi:hypothetical protein BJV92_001749 [Clostridium beijerinckii]|nr:hypothetical protein [Clostridium beijerinckii]